MCNTNCFLVGSSTINVSCIYRISRPGESNDIVATGLGNYRMLWKGTNILNLMSILHKGLQPSEAPSGGNLPNFGKVRNLLRFCVDFARTSTCRFAFSRAQCKNSLCVFAAFLRLIIYCFICLKLAPRANTSQLFIVVFASLRPNRFSRRNYFKTTLVRNRSGSSFY